MAARKLVAYVHVDGHVFEPGDSPAKEYADQITNPKAWGEVSDSDADGGSKPGGDLFDPSAEGNGIDEVNNHLADSDEDEVARVLAAEAAGKKRKGILEGPYAPDPA